jgi:sterol desaturase/sphingolipid hydroxylase (fatty acid hydroxylase superfamily)
MVLTPVLPAWIEPTDVVRLHVFLAFVILFVLLERLLPGRPHGWQGRATGNIGLQLLNAGLVAGLALTAPISLSAATLYAQFNQWGFFNHLELGLWTRIVIAWIVLDLIAYWWHRLWHLTPLLWRFHRIHHIDEVLDVTTTFRTHPLETVATLLMKAGLVMLLGVPLLGIIIYEVIVATMALWIHSNIRVFRPLDRVLSWIVVTPSLHRVHHGSDPEEYNHNFGLVLTIWDRLFGTFRMPTGDVSGPGLDLPSGTRSAGLGNMLMLPFRRSV